MSNDSDEAISRALDTLQKELDETAAASDLVAPPDLMAIGEKIVEMADRVSAIDPAVPGAEAKWFFDMDRERYQVIVKVAGAA